MIYSVNISTDSLRICDGKEIEARSSMEAVLAALHHETSAYKHLRDLPMALLRIEVNPPLPHALQPVGGSLPENVIPLTLNQEAGNC